MDKAEKKSHRIQIIVALIGVAGVLGAAVISHSDKIFKKPIIPPPGSHGEPNREPEGPDVVGEGPVGVVPPPKPGTVVPNSIDMNMVYIPAGQFMMGSSDSPPKLAREYKRYFPIGEPNFSDEFPPHKVQISEGFWMGQTEVTQAQYESVVKAQPWSGTPGIKEDADMPALCVTWDDAVAFCSKLSHWEGKNYRLPTEAEWEYACRAGATTQFSFGESDSLLGEYAWFNDSLPGLLLRELRPEKYKPSGLLWRELRPEEYKTSPHPVRQKKPNPWGLYDMHGNVLEWCSDWYAEDYYSKSPSVDPTGPASGIYRSLRGGCFEMHNYRLRCSERMSHVPDLRDRTCGFRVVCSQ